MSSKSVQSVIDKVKELVAEYPDNKYMSPDAGFCYYTKGNNATTETKGCLFGQALISLYPDLEEEIKIHEYKGSSPGIITLMYMLGFKPTREEEDWLARVQCNQDSTKPWGECIDV